MSAKPGFDQADSRALFDDRGYSGLTIKGQNPALLLEKGLRERIQESLYFKESCFALNAATLCDRAVELQFVGGTTGVFAKPTPFICLLLKLLALVPEDEIVLEMLNFRDDDDDEDEAEQENGQEKSEEEQQNGSQKQEDAQNAIPQQIKDLKGNFKYLRVLAACYIRLAWEPAQIYKTLEPLLLDYRKIRVRKKDGFTLSSVDQIADDLLTKTRIFGTALWQLPPRSILEDLDLLEPRESPLADEVDAMDEDEVRSRGSRRSSASRSRSRSRSRSWSHSRDGRSRSRSRERSWTRSRSASRSPRRERESGSNGRSRSRSRDYRRRSRSGDSRDDG